MSPAEELASHGYLSEARRLVRDFVNLEEEHHPIDLNQLYVISCHKIFDDWQVLVGTTRDQIRVYEVSYNAHTSEKHLKVYDTTYALVISN